VTHAQQQTDKVWRVGYLSSSSATNFSVAVVDAFRLKLNDLGYVEGRNLDLYMRRANDDFARLPSLANELVALAPDVIVSVTTIATLALQRARPSIPIVMVATGDPIGNGFIKSLAKPGGNITGLSNQSLDSIAKSLELLHVALPNAKRIAVLMSDNPSHGGMVKEAFLAAGTLGMTIIPVTARTLNDLGDDFAKMHSENCDALFVFSETLITARTPCCGSVIEDKATPCLQAGPEQPRPHSSPRLTTRRNRRQGSDTDPSRGSPLDPNPVATRRVARPTRPEDCSYRKTRLRPS
jgi:putative ABC transport system substrate-binding protein